MLGGVLGVAAWPAPAQLRSAPRPALLHQRVAPASRCSQRCGRRARLDWGCAARLATAAAADGEPGPAARPTAAEGEAAQAEPQKRRQKAPNTGELGEKTADGKPEPDERTVEDLVRRGWFESEDDAVELLTRKPSRTERFAFETAKPAADWLEATLGLELLKGGVPPAAKAVQRFPDLLYQDAATLQRKWDALTLPAEQGGAGIAFSHAQAREAVVRFPQVLSFALDTLFRGWWSLTATEGGLGLSPEEAQQIVLKNTHVLSSDAERFTKRVELLQSLGYPKAYEMVLKETRVLNYKDETVREHTVWWKQSGLDHRKILEAHSDLLGSPSTADLQAKLDLLARVAGMSTAELNRAGVAFTYSLDKRLRARYFYALQKGRLARFRSMNTMFNKTDATFLAMLQNQPSGTRASELEVARYDKLVNSAKFVAWRERQEARIKAERAASLRLDDAT
jgi:hypothetical protein